MTTNSGATEKQIIALEEEIAHLRLANDELSDELLAQSKRIEELEGGAGNLDAPASDDVSDEQPEDQAPKV